MAKIRYAYVGKGCVNFGGKDHFDGDPLPDDLHPKTLADLKKQSRAVKIDPKPAEEDEAASPVVDKDTMKKALNDAGAKHVGRGMWELPDGERVKGTGVAYAHLMKGAENG